MTDKLDITLTVNGRDYPVRVEPRRTLVDTIRDECGLTGTHIGCEHGVCGACTVIVEGEAVRSCLMFAVQADGKDIRTVEGLADGRFAVYTKAHHSMLDGVAALRLMQRSLSPDPDARDCVPPWSLPSRSPSTSEVSHSGVDPRRLLKIGADVMGDVAGLLPASMRIANQVIRDGDVTLVPRGHHPVGAPYGYDLYYLNVMAGPRRAWRFQGDPEHAWLVERDAVT